MVIKLTREQKLEIALKTSLNLTGINQFSKDETQRFSVVSYIDDVLKDRLTDDMLVTTYKQSKDIMLDVIAENEEDEAECKCESCANREECFEEECDEEEDDEVDVEDIIDILQSVLAGIKKRA